MARLFADESSEYLERTASVPVSAEPFAVAAWVYPDEEEDLAIWCVSDTDSTCRHHLHIQDDPAGQIQAQSREGSDTEFAASTANASLNEWAHVVGLWVAANDRRVLLNGGNKGTDTNSLSVTSLDRTLVGRLYQNGVYYYPFSGRIAEVGVWDLSDWPGATASDKADAFEARAIPALAAGYSPLCIPLGLVAYWPLGGCLSSDNEANAAGGDRDIVGAYNLSPYNTPSVADHPPIVYPTPSRLFSAAAAAGSVTVELAAAAMSAVGPSLTVVPGEVAIIAGAPYGTMVAPALTITPGEAAVALAGAAGIVAAGTVQVAPGEVTVTLTSGVMTGVACSIVASPGAVAVAFGAVSATAVAGSITISGGEAQIALGAAVVTAAAPSGRISLRNIIALAAADTALSAPAVTVAPGEVTVDLAGAALAFSVGAVTITVVTYTLSETLRRASTTEDTGVRRGPTSTADTLRRAPQQDDSIRRR